MKTKAQSLKRGDVFRLHVYGQVLAIEPIANGKRVRVKIALEDQGGRRQRGTTADKTGSGDLEFTDGGHAVEFICKPSKAFHVYDDGWDDGEDDGDPVFDPDPEHDLMRVD